METSSRGNQLLTMVKFIEKHNLTMTTRRATSNPFMGDSEGMTHWRCTLKIDSKPGFALYFSQGSAFNGKPPGIKDVLQCLGSDAAMLENARDFEEYASELCIDADSRAEERKYLKCVEQNNKFRDFLGVDAYLELCWDIEQE